MHEKFIARQPIFDTRLKVYAYELLFRGGPENFFQPRTHSSASVITDATTLFDLDMLAGRARAFVNVDELALRLGAPRLLPADRIVVEILETVKPTPDIVEICHELRAAGYLLALDDFVDDPSYEPLVKLAQFLKVDFKLTDSDARKLIAQKYRSTDVWLIAEKVETAAELEEARKLGFCYFQGYFFCKPAMIETREIPGNKLIQLQLLAAVAGQELDYAAIEGLLKQEPSLLYRLLRYLNSPAVGLRSEVHSIRDAMMLLGERDFRRWVSVFCIVTMSGGKPPEIVRTALTRAYFCEDFSQTAGVPEKSSSLFLMGLLSIVDALLDKPMEEVLRTLPISQDVKTALNGGKNRLRDIHELLLALEQAEWPQLSTFTEKLGCSEESIPESYKTALKKSAAIGL
jgi:c-di-GMP-related signal transduction protein